MILRTSGHHISKQGRKMPLRIVLVVPFVLQIFTAVGLTGWLSLRNGQEAVNEVTTQLRSEVTARIQQHLQTYLETPHRINAISVDAILRFRLWNPDDMSAMRSYFFWQLQQFPTVNYISFAGESKEYAGAGYKPNDGTPVIEITDKSTHFINTIISADSEGNPTQDRETNPKYDPRIRPWYKAAKQAEKPVWNKIYQYYIQASLGISLSQPVYDKTGKFIGVVSTDLFLSKVSDFLQTLKVGRSGQTFIVERSGAIVASSTTEKPFIKSSDGTKVQRLKATESSVPLIQNTAKHLTERFGNLSQINSNQQFDFIIEGNREFVQVLPFKEGRGLDWLIVVVIPEADFMEQINANTRTTILLCLGSLGLATFLGMMTARWISRPIFRLSQASSAIASGQLEQKIEVQSVDELEILAQSFNQMAIQLRESFETLEKTNAELEIRVEKRTAELKEAKIAADTANQAKSEFLANMSHELRTPLNGILGYAQILERDREILPKQKDGISIIYQCGSHLLNLINDILDLSKIEAQRMELELRDFHFPSFLREVVEICSIRADRKDISFTYQPLTQLPITVRADEKRLRQVLINLIGNAIKFTDKGGVTFKVEVLENRQWPVESREESANYSILNSSSDVKVCFQIEDTGIGLNKNEIEKIFLPFEQVGSSDRKAEEGTGLGLAITQKIVQLMGGELTVESTPGKGSIFRLDLEMHQTSQNLVLAFPHPSKTIQGFKGDRKKILVVDDRVENRLFIKDFLESIGFQVQEACNGKEGLAKAIEFKPDLIVVDLLMPVMDGCEMAQKLRNEAEFKETVLIASSASVYKSDRQKTLEAGYDDFLPKPIQIEELLEKLQKYLQLQWIYEETQKIETINSLDPAVSSIFHPSLVAPPPEELVSLFKAARIGDIEVIEQEATRIKYLDGQYVPFAERLLQLTKEFEEKAILKLVQQYL